MGQAGPAHNDQHLKKLFKKYKGFPIFWNMV